MLGNTVAQICFYSFKTGKTLFSNTLADGIVNIKENNLYTLGKTNFHPSFSNNFTISQT